MTDLTTNTEEPKMGFFIVVPNPLRRGTKVIPLCGHTPCGRHFGQPDELPRSRWCATAGRDTNPNNKKLIQ